MLIWFWEHNQIIDSQTHWVVNSSCGKWKGVSIYFESVMVWGKVAKRDDGICRSFDKNVKRGGGKGFINDQGSLEIGGCRGKKEIKAYHNRQQLLPQPQRLVLTVIFYRPFSWDQQVYGAVETDIINSVSDMVQKFGVIESFNHFERATKIIVECDDDTTCNQWLSSIRSNRLVFGT